MSVGGSPCEHLVRFEAPLSHRAHLGQDLGCVLANTNTNLLFQATGNKTSLPQHRGVWEWNLSSCWLLNSVPDVLKVSVSSADVARGLF